MDKILSKILDYCIVYKEKELPEDAIMNMAMEGYGGNADDAYQLGFEQGMAYLAKTLTKIIND